MQFVPLNKRSKKAQREFYAQKRGSWHGVNPISRTVQSIVRCLTIGGNCIERLNLPSLGGSFLKLGTEDDLLVQSNAKLLQMDGSLERRLKSAEAALEPYQQYL